MRLQYTYFGNLSWMAALTRTSQLNRLIILSRIMSLHGCWKMIWHNQALLYGRAWIAGWLLNANGKRKHVFRSAFHCYIICALVVVQSVSLQERVEREIPNNTSDIDYEIDAIWATVQRSRPSAREGTKTECNVRWCVFGHGQLTAVGRTVALLSCRAEREKRVHLVQ